MFFLRGVCRLRVRLQSDTNVVLSEEGEELAASLGIPFYSTSAFTGQNIEEAFADLAARMYATYSRKAGLGDAGPSGPGRPAGGSSRDVKAVADGGARKGGAPPGRPDWRREASEIDINEVERRGVQLHKEREAAAHACSC